MHSTYPKLLAALLLIGTLLALVSAVPIPPSGFDDFAGFNFTAAGAYKASGYLRMMTNGVADNTEASHFIIDPTGERMYFYLGASGGAGWILANGTFNMAPVQPGSSQYMCAYTAGTYHDQVANYISGMLHKATFSLAECDDHLRLYQGAVNDTSSCGRTLPMAITADDDGYLTSMSVTYKLCPAPNYPVIIQQLTQYTIINHSASVVNQIPSLPDLCQPPMLLNYCDLFLAYDC